MNQTIHRRATQIALGIGALYAFAGVGWVLLSDALVLSVSTDTTWVTLAQRYKGIAFMLVSALGLVALVRSGNIALLRAQAHLQAGELRVHDLFLHHPTPMWVFDDASLRFLAVNRAAVAHYGHTEDEFLAMTADTLQTAEAPRLTSLLRRREGVHIDAGVLPQRKKDGSLCAVRLSLHRIELQQRSATLVIADDVTAAQAAARAQQQLHEELERRVKERTAELRFVNQELDAFSRTAAHDLKSPLNAIIGFVDLLRLRYAALLGAEGDAMTGHIAHAARSMNTLINDLLALSRVTTHELRRAPVDLSALARQLLDDLRAAEPQRRVEAFVADGLEVEADAGLLRSLLCNLIGNAWKYSGKRDVALIKIGRDDGADGDGPTFHVRDNGAGFDVRQAHKLFKPFQRLHAASEFAGTGVGLATCQRIVRRHGGHIWLTSTPGEGTTVHFTLSGAAPPPGALPRDSYFATLD